MTWQQVPSSRPPCRTQSKLAARAEEERETEPCARRARSHHFQPAATARFAWRLTGGDAGRRVPTPRHKARSRIARSAGLPAALAVLALFGGVWAGAAGAGSHAPEPVAGSRRLLGHGPRPSSAARGPPGAAILHQAGGTARLARHRWWFRGMCDVGRFGSWWGRPVPCTSSVQK